MSAWYAKNLGDAMLAGDDLEQLKALFHTLYPDSELNQEMAVFVRHESEGLLHCQVKLYFSPATQRLAEISGASPCGRPTSHSLSLLIGSESVMLKYFPEIDD